MWAKSPRGRGSETGACCRSSSILSSRARTVLMLLASHIRYMVVWWCGCCPGVDAWNLAFVPGKLLVALRLVVVVVERHVGERAWWRHYLGEPELCVAFLWSPVPQRRCAPFRRLFLWSRLRLGSGSVDGLDVLRGFVRCGCSGPGRPV